MISDKAQICSLADQAIQTRPQVYQDVRGGKERAINGLIGVVMKLTGGNVDAELLMDVMREKCGLTPLPKAVAKEPEVTATMLRLTMTGMPYKKDNELSLESRYYCANENVEFTLQDCVNGASHVPEAAKNYILSQLVSS